MIKMCSECFTLCCVIHYYKSVVQLSHICFVFGFNYCAAMPQLHGFIPPVGYFYQLLFVVSVCIFIV